MKKKALKTILNKKCLRICCCFKIIKICCSMKFDDRTIQIVSGFLLNSLIRTSMSSKHLTEDLISVKSSFLDNNIFKTVRHTLIIKMETLHLSFFQSALFFYSTTSHNRILCFQNTLVLITTNSVLFSVPIENAPKAGSK